MESTIKETAVYDLHSAGHCPEILDYLDDNGLLTAADILFGNTNFLKIEDERIEFAKLLLGSTLYIIYFNPYKKTKEKEIRTTLMQFCSDERSNCFAMSDNGWNNFQEKSIAYGTGSSYAIWNYKPN